MAFSVLSFHCCLYINEQFTHKLSMWNRQVEDLVNWVSFLHVSWKEWISMLRCLQYIQQSRDLAGDGKWALFFTGFKIIFSTSYNNWHCMAAFELFGFLIGRIDAKAGIGKRKSLQNPKGHTCQGFGWHSCPKTFFMPAIREMKRIWGLKFFRSGILFFYYSNYIITPTAGKGWTLHFSHFLCGCSS